MHTKMTFPELVTFRIFEGFPELVHGFSTRKGGVSKPPFDALNLGLSTGDNPRVVEQNRERYFNALGIVRERVVFPQQVHSADVQIVTAPGIVEQCDALITQKTNLFLSIQTADCFPVFLFHPQTRTVAIVHSGWRGTAQNIVGKAVRLMREKLGVPSAELLVAIGPGVQQSCYQVDQKTAEHFLPQYLLPDGPGHFKLDVQGAIVYQLKEVGIPEGNIEMDQRCTHCEATLFYSYRRDGQKSGRMMGIIGLKG